MQLNANGLGAHNYKKADFNSWGVLAVTYSKYNSIDKVSVYHNGKLLEDNADIPETQVGRNVRPRIHGKGGIGLERGLFATIGGVINAASNFSASPLPGKLGPMILASRMLDDNEINEVSNLMLKGEL